MKSQPSPPTLTVSTIINGTLYANGEPLPFSSVDDPEFPKLLKRYVVAKASAAEPPAQRQ